MIPQKLLMDTAAALTLFQRVAALPSAAQLSRPLPQVVNRAIVVLQKHSPFVPSVQSSAVPFINERLVGVRSFHSTTIIQSRRRRRRGSPTSSSGPENTASSSSSSDTPALMDVDDFARASAALLDKLHTSLRPLLSINENMTVTRGHTGEEQQQQQHDNSASDSEIVLGDYLLIDLGPVDGMYTLQADGVFQQIHLISPISGQHYYQYNCAKSEDWCCVVDGHNLEGIFVRDLIRQIKGVPQL